MKFAVGKNAVRAGALILAMNLAALTASTVNGAQIFQCVKEGKTSFQEAPCDPKSSVSKSITARTPGPQALWDGLKYDMTVNEIRQKVPNAISKSEDSLASGAREQLRLERVQVAGLSFTAQFFFGGERFRQVNYAGPMMVSNEDNLRAFNQVLADFRTTHGRESRHKVSDERFGLSASADWFNESGNVWIVIVPVTATTSLLNFGFTPTRR
jgi:hypothetical protein